MKTNGVILDLNPATHSLTPPLHSTNSQRETKRKFRNHFWKAVLNISSDDFYNTQLKLQLELE